MDGLEQERKHQAHVVEKRQDELERERQHQAKVVERHEDDLNRERLHQSQLAEQRRNDLDREKFQGPGSLLQNEFQHGHDWQGGRDLHGQSMMQQQQQWQPHQQLPQQQQFQQPLGSNSSVPITDVHQSSQGVAYTIPLDNSGGSADSHIMQQLPQQQLPQQQQFQQPLGSNSSVPITDVHQSSQGVAYTIPLDNSGGNADSRIMHDQRPPM